MDRARVSLPKLPLVAAASLFAGCGGGGGGGEDSGAPPGSAPFGLTQRVVVEGLAFPPSQGGVGEYSITDPFPNLAAGGLFLTGAGDGSQRLYSVFRDGHVESIDLAQPDLGVAPQFLDITHKVLTTGEAGLLGLAFHPDYEVNGHVFVHYVRDDLTTIVSRFTRSSTDPLAVDPASELVIFARPRTSDFHCGGMIAFDAQGWLYVSLGDDGNGANAQDVTSPFGKILRLDANAIDTPAPGNPFAGFGLGGDSAYVWALGLRNTWRFSFDRVTGLAIGADLGEDSMEEVNLLVAGGNYGWPHFEGTIQHSAYSGPLPLFPPIHTYGRDQGQAITGGYVYRGSALPSLYGAYVFGDYIAGRIWALRIGASGAVVEEIANGTGILLTFGEDDDGELYFSGGGQCLTLEETSGGPGPVLPPLLSDTGIFADLATLETVPGIIPYDVVSPLWSDGAAKRRWIALPGMEQIAFHPSEPWTFPDGTVFVKHFELALSNGTTRRLETRVLWVDGGQWDGVTYRWNEAGTDAELLTQGGTLDVEVADPYAPGGALAFTWRFPSQADCLTCHNEPAGRALGVHTAQLNEDFDYGAVVDNQLRSWNHIELFTTDIGPHTNPAFLEYVDPADVTQPLAKRARSYLAANCGGCHRDEGPYHPFLDFDLRAGFPAVEMNVVDVAANYTPDGFKGPHRVQSFDHESSILWQRMETLGPFRMPLLGSNRVDHLGLEVVGDWIDIGAGD